MVAPLVCGSAWGDHALRDATCVPARVDMACVSFVHFFFRRLFMQWTTPTASDFRFGFEITMYVSAR